MKKLCRDYKTIILALNPLLKSVLRFWGGVKACPNCLLDTFAKLIVKSGKLKVFTLSCHLRPLVGDPANGSLLSFNRLDSRATHENDGNELFNLSTIKFFNSMKGGYAPC